LTAGYSGTPLVKKLGIKPGYRIAILNVPNDYANTLGELPPDVTHADLSAGMLNFIHFFTTSRAELEAEFLTLKAALSYSGILWISWPKRASKVPTDLNEDIIRQIALDNGLVDVKVAAVDETWSALKLVYRVKDRP
jgi:hypothetical protein